MLCFTAQYTKSTYHFIWGKNVPNKTTTIDTVHRRILLVAVCCLLLASDPDFATTINTFRIRININRQQINRLGGLQWSSCWNTILNLIISYSDLRRLYSGIPSGCLSIWEFEASNLMWVESKTFCFHHSFEFREAGIFQERGVRSQDTRFHHDVKCK